MSKTDFPITTAIRELRQFKIDFEPFLYEYEEKGGTAQTARELNVDEHSVIKTLVVSLDDSKLAIVLMHGDKNVSMKELARQINCKKAEPADANSATKATGYQFGGTSPFGTKKKMDVYCEKSIFDLDKIYINGGKRGFIIAMQPSDLRKVFKINEVEVAI